MPSRSITDDEIGLIKAMLKRGMANKDIQFYFNRQDRACNSGRITGIRNRSYGPEVPLASDEALSRFLAHFSSPGIIAPTVQTQAASTESRDPLDPVRLRSLFARKTDGGWRCAVGETDEHECKQSFNLRRFTPALKTIAGFANNRGGYLFFGVKDKPDGFSVCGLADDRFTETDQNKFSQTIRSTLEPTPRFRIASLDLDGLTVGVIHVEPHPAKPVIVSRNEGEVAEGAIYYRYPGETKPICYPDLRAILDERDRHSREAIMPMVQRLLELGPNNALVANLADGRLEGGDRPILIDQQLVDRIRFIREGQFDERDGAETLRLIGDVGMVDLSGVTATKTVRTEVTEEAIIRNFVARVPVEEPLSYVRQASHENSYLLPIFYYLHLAGETRAGAIASLRRHREAKPKTRDEIIKRLQGTRTLFDQARAKRLAVLNDIRLGNLAGVTTPAEAVAMLGALTGLRGDDAQTYELANELLRQALNLWSGDRAFLSHLRRAASRLDELVYGPLVT
ncbi:MULTISPECIES: ATP-binding protein [unclassified Sphingomonas]|uniref:AlbA family DNA-binding domain-containing protein n=1 Tax=unclassified Sphingomonas TaxID=196159 RepID=UPI002860ACA5|nr:MULTISPECIES: ATP-binding protein [unclassified Sphingomonas]MDR6114493.1 hypothetical protein [Sphingomonas sp. SORGH_AS_0789]MDR6148148.1 hypothetical protein [Sphingomonas sp. SORGH_AS_0742]